mmetsp:Transcript_6280/g.19376  ORF Transcript_6280/g.19376 Transcript_6280/m.19376 type:complete len:272 (+) Transcript_6280:1680-2495(+)
MFHRPPIHLSSGCTAGWSGTAAAARLARWTKTLWLGWARDSAASSCWTASANIPRAVHTAPRAAAMHAPQLARSVQQRPRCAPQQSSASPLRRSMRRAAELSPPDARRQRIPPLPLPWCKRLGGRLLVWRWLPPWRSSWAGRALRRAHCAVPRCWPPRCCSASSAAVRLTSRSALSAARTPHPGIWQRTRHGPRGVWIVCVCVRAVLSHFICPPGKGLCHAGCACDDTGLRHGACAGEVGRIETVKDCPEAQFLACSAMWRDMLKFFPSCE